MTSAKLVARLIPFVRHTGRCSFLRIEHGDEFCRCGLEQLLLDVEALSARLKMMEGALAPFADYADKRGLLPDDFVITQGSPLVRRQLTMGDCYRASAALNEGGSDVGK